VEPLLDLVFLGLGLVCQPWIYIVLVDEVVVDGGRGLLFCKHSSCASLFLSLHIQDDPEDGMMLAPTCPKLNILHTPSAKNLIIPGKFHSTIGTRLTFARIYTRADNRGIQNECIFGNITAPRTLNEDALSINISTSQELEAESGNVGDQQRCRHLAPNCDEHHAKASVCTVIVVLFDS
jgi:hypothetical protein